MPDNSPVLTVVIPVRNREKIVTATLDSVAAQTLRPFSLIIVDNASSDHTAQVVRQWADRHRSSSLEITVLNEPEPGASRARNTGLAAVSTEWTLFFDSDDIMAPGHLSRILDSIAADPKNDLLFWDVEYMALDGSRRLFQARESDLPYNNLMHGVLSTQRYCARTELFRKAGGWDPELSSWDDIELSNRILCLNPRTHKITGRPSVRIHANEVSITGTSFSSSLQKSLMALDAISAHYTSLGPQSHIMLKRVILAANCVREGTAEAVGIYKKVLDEESCSCNRLAYRIAFHLVKKGIRGSATFVKPLLR